MTAGDWFNSVVNVVLGLLSGIVVYKLLLMVTTGYWGAAIIIVLGVGFLAMVERGVDHLFDWLFPSGIRAPQKHYEKTKAPLARRISFPLSFVLGAIVALIGLDSSFTQLLP